MYTLNELIKASKTVSDGKTVRLAVLGSCSTQFITKAVRGCGVKRGMNILTFESDYDQITEQIVDSRSALYSFEPDIVMIYMCSEKLYEEFCSDPEPESFAEKQLGLIRGLHKLIAERTSARVLQFGFAEINDGVFGNFGAKVRSSFIFQIRKLNYLLQELMAEEKNVFPVDLPGIQSEIGYEQLFPKVQYHNAKLTVDLKYIPMLAKNIVDIIAAMYGSRKKCVITDLDNTVWGGNAGDCDPGDLEIGASGRGHAFLEYQRFLKQLKNRGIILAVCSKNNEETAKLPFTCLDEMVLRLDDFVLFSANWENKASNVRSIIESLNISPDSVVFIDDNSFERNNVRELVPGVSVPELPESPEEYVSALRQCNFFETSSYSGEDRLRTEQYRTEFRRRTDIADFGDYDDYLKSLEMKAKAEPFSKLMFARIAELSQRSNQFNLRTVRYTEEEISSIAASPEYITRCFTLSDKYGSYGMISAVIMKKLSPDTLFIDTWILSCRVLKRGMEEFIINTVVRAAAENGFTRIEAEYIPTPKNSMVKDIYDRYGFTPAGGGRYELLVRSFREFPCRITEIQEEKK